MKTERIYLNASCMQTIRQGEVIGKYKVIHTSVSDGCITVRHLHWWERLLHWLKGLL